jgi:tetratricopeptide (TPR) repeat protein
LLENHYAKEIKADRLLLYLSAAGRAARGLDAEATDFAQRAYDHIDDDGEQRSGVGDVIADLGHHDWAEREWRYVIAEFPLTSAHSMIARTSLANWCLHDRGEDKEAADLLGEVCDAVDNDAEAKGAVLADSEANYYLNKMLRTQRDYFTACYQESQKDYKAQRKSLERAFTRNHKDPDVLIAMYRLKETDDTYRERVMGRIARALAEVEQEIENDPSEPTGYNHYAWLVSNTEGDFDKAVRYSLKSLELSPETPSYLDTLGRCYYAAGDLKNAIKHQRKAVEMHPRVKVMQKQLEMFEKAAAEKK